MFPRTSQRVKMAGSKQRVKVELARAEARPIGEVMRMKIHSIDEEKRQKPGMEMAGMKWIPHFSELRRTKIRLKARSWLAERSPVENDC